MTALPTAVAERVGKILGRLGSDHDGEIVAAGRALVKTLTGAGLGIADLAEHVIRPPETWIVYRDRPAPPPPHSGPTDYGDWRSTWQGLDPRKRHRAQVTKVRCAPPGFLSPWEQEFAAGLARTLDRGRALTPRQEVTLTGIHERFMERFG